MVYRAQLSPLHSLFLSLFERGKKNRFLAFLPLLTRCLNTHSETHVPFLLFFFLLVDQRSLSSRATRFSRIRGKRTKVEKTLLREDGGRCSSTKTLRIIGSLLLLYVHRFQTNSPWPISKKNILCEESSSEWMNSPSGKVFHSVINFSNSTENLPSCLLLKSDSPLILNKNPKKKIVLDVSKRYFRDALIPRQLRDPHLIHALNILDDKRMVVVEKCRK